MTPESPLLLNFGHPLTDPQRAEIAAHLGTPPRVHEVRPHIERHRPLADIAHELIENIGLSADEWQTEPLLINPPGLAPLALALIAELHGRCGYFLPMVHIRPVEGALPPRYEVAEIVNLNTMRETARTRR
ncbi:MAG: hypothetical protein HC884_16140 [Chloroflexaceae bacterium]|nr:hypothetical protein [Chloroflexaceae bacterium]